MSISVQCIPFAKKMNVEYIIHLISNLFLLRPFFGIWNTLTYCNYLISGTILKFSCDYYQDSYSYFWGFITSRRLRSQVAICGLCSSDVGMPILYSSLDWQRIETYIVTLQQFVLIVSSNLNRGIQTSTAPLNWQISFAFPFPSLYFRSPKSDREECLSLGKFSKIPFHFCQMDADAPIVMNRNNIFSMSK